MRYKFQVLSNFAIILFIAHRHLNNPSLMSTISVVLEATERASTCGGTSSVAVGSMQAQVP